MYVRTYVCMYPQALGPDQVLDPDTFLGRLIVQDKMEVAGGKVLAVLVIGHELDTRDATVFTRVRVVVQDF